MNSLTWIKGGRVDSRGIDGRTLSAVRLGGIHSDGRRCDVARQTAAAAAGRDVENGGACRATCLDIVGWMNKPQDEVVENDARERGKVADLGKDGKQVMGFVWMQWMYVIRLRLAASSEREGVQGVRETGGV
jgi:hypothetical protein